MPVLLDNQPLTPPGPSLGEALQAGCTAAEGSGRIVVEIFLDRSAIDPAELLRRAEAPLGQGTLELTSVNPAALVRSTLHDVADAIDGVRADQAAAATALQQGRLDEAMKLLGGFVPVWEQAQRAVEYSAHIMGWSVEALVAQTDEGEIRLGAEVARLTETLSEIKRCLQARDWAGLSDALAFDMDDHAARWRILLAALAGNVAAS